jgi:hypothetical protein
MNRKEFENRIIKEKGQEYLDKNKELLNAQFDYIESLGDPNDDKSLSRNDLIISVNN